MLAVESLETFTGARDVVRQRMSVAPLDHLDGIAKELRNRVVVQPRSELPRGIRVPQVMPARAWSGEPRIAPRPSEQSPRRVLRLERFSKRRREYKLTIGGSSRSEPMTPHRRD